ncbi:phosphatase PAP2 family protein [Actinomadura rupiterrae]|uniref:phosphatase PAP2 family protein n=1 Tax=Actinomadura rupiterrae TaxID=559627 RepID=UPI0026464D61|nr:phosphatase PAP2 family protein [Actinomadura rupiterrae]MCP2343274.1 undecaprenyl-diphosphatase [Actinomadura rupiterrae]
MRAPGISVEVYRSITEFAHGTPGWVHTVAEVGTDAGLLAFVALFAAGWWRARTRDARSMALALLAPVAMACAYLASSNAKDVLQEERPCRAVPHAMNIAACPAPGDWSFPSNHATIAAGSAAALLIAWRALAPYVLPLAALMAFSRVFVGVHYPHDVAAGFLVGLTAASAVSLLAARPLTPAVERLRRWDPLGPLVLGTPAPAPAGGYGNGHGHGADMPVAGRTRPAAKPRAPQPQPQPGASVTVPDLPVLDGPGPHTPPVPQARVGQPRPAAPSTRQAPAGPHAQQAPAAPDRQYGPAGAPGNAGPSEAGGPAGRHRRA